MMLKKILTLSASLLFLLTANMTQATDISPKPFTENSLNYIIEQRKGQPIIVALWSIECPPCMAELALLQEMQSKFSADNIVLIATDSPDYIADIMQVLSDYDLSNTENWLFADTFPERLRYAIDPSWYGELPRTYFYDKTHQRKAHSGLLTKAMLEQWLTTNSFNQP